MLPRVHSYFSFFFFNDTATTEIYTLSLHDALPISTFFSFESHDWFDFLSPSQAIRLCRLLETERWATSLSRSEEHTSELQSRPHLVCRLLLEKKNTLTDVQQTTLEVMSGCQFNYSS